MASDGAEVADDYRLALEDLSSNMRFEISNLTVIARENTEHALAIAQVLQEHILKAAPNKKLPALYVMDSIVKNVGTPYTLYFGRNLFKTFMESYAVVDHGVRRKMEEMLKTWKDPVPGSMDTRPPFAHELVRPIENALMKARAASMPQPAQGPIPGRPRANMFPHRNTPTPPGGRGFPGPATGYPQQQHQQQQQQQMPYHHAPHSAPPSQSSTPVPFFTMSTTGAVAPVGISVENLSNDIQELIVAMKAEFSQNPHDASVQNRLRALLDLQGVVQHSNLPADQLELIKNKVTELAVTLRPAPGQNHYAHALPAAAAAAAALSSTSAPPPLSSSASSSVSPTPVSHIPAAAHPAPVSVAPAAANAITLDTLLGKGAMAALLGMQSAISQPLATTMNAHTNNGTNSGANVGSNVNINTTQPPLPFPGVVMPSSSSPSSLSALHAEPPKPGAALSLLDQLRAAGMLPAATPSNSSASTSIAATPAPLPALPLHHHPPPPLSAPALPPTIANFLAAQKGEAMPGHVRLDLTAMKHQFRPDAIAALYDDLGPPCTQCGRRFRTDEEGRKKKTAHMDWHFTVHQRSTEAEKRGTHRSWYVDQQDWQKAREAVDAIHDVTNEDQDASATNPPEEAKYMAVPDPSSGINNVCPICQDRFENKWLDTVQEWVWLDTVLVGNRAYHASCHAEATRDREATPGMPRRTPEPVLGKRKAEGGLGSPKLRVQKTYV